MTSGLDDRPSATMFTVENLVNMAQSGEIRIPHFQRDFRWQRQDVVRLFDSIVRGYPVGSLLLWRRPAQAQLLKLGSLEIQVPAVSAARWVVDGQQRITSLASALIPEASRDPRFALAYNLREQEFVPTPAEEEPLIVPLPVLFNLTRVLRWVQKFPETLEYVDRANNITQTLRQFQIPAYEVTQNDVKVLQDIFDRMNNYGKRLSRAEIFSALFADDEDIKNRLTFDKIAEHLDEDLGFGTVDNDTILMAMLARRGPDVKREIRNEFGGEQGGSRGNHLGRAIIDFPDETRDTAYRLGEAAMRRAIAFLQEEAGVPHVGMLPYRHLLVVLTRLFAHHPNPDSRSIRLLRRWFWRAAVVGPEVFKGSTTGAVRFLVFAVKPNDLNGSIQELLSLVDYPKTPPPDLRRFRSNEAATKIVLCSWWANMPRSLDDGNPFDREDLSDVLLDRPTALDAVRYIVPRTTIPHEYRLWAANRALVPAVEANSASIEPLVTQRPLALSEAAWQAALASHLISSDMTHLITEGRTVDFLKARQVKLQSQLTSFLERMCEWNFENTPPLISLLIEDLAEEDGRA
ncbi:GmrSD restriction endonuclease domain-containing protein [Streptomyces acidiscabies]|uniref:GmrSD restriction endonuclease domain-containing protein n=1 Tax=Streptomyces acidiscabies TaxID=42234 RepID=UPI000AC0B741|nr:DUF262 domain-containing protein [Streptomyces acidiscabies]